MKIIGGINFHHKIRLMQDLFLTTNGTNRHEFCEQTTLQINWIEQIEG
jgi:hypothetical protein